MGVAAPAQNADDKREAKPWGKYSAFWMLNISASKTAISF
jgi:hypothetical protein